MILIVVLAVVVMGKEMLMAKQEVKDTHDSP